MNTNTLARDFANGDAGYAPVAIVGIGCRFPGGIESPQTYWRFLAEGRDGTREPPPARWSLDEFYDSDPEAIGKTYVRRGGFLDEISGFDPQFFGISPREAAYMDPQQRLLLEVTWEAFEDAGIRPSSWAHRNVGVYVGLFTHDYENLHMRLSEQPLCGPHSATGMSTTIAANRLSHAFNFIGPSMVIDTACSSSLVAVHLACRALHNGEAEIAVAGGVNLQITPELTIALSKASMLSPDGRCKSFDARANGYARADGAGMVLLKRLADAIAAGDDIYAVVEGSAVNQDGRSKGITVPNGESQMRVMRDAIACSGIQPHDITYIEAHGTGTPVGDPIEVNALGAVLNDRQSGRPACVIGSVKSNFGHTESAAGVAGLIKVALMQRHGRIPANLHFETPNPAIPFDSLNLRVPTQLEDWQPGDSGRLVAGINSFGFGGTNAHAIIGPAPLREAAPANKRTTDGRAFLLCLSARSAEALLASARHHAEFLRSAEGQASDLADIAAALAFERDHHPFRLAATARTHDDAIRLLEAYGRDLQPPGLVTGTVGSDVEPGLAFVFSGMGQQWWAMGRGLLQSEPVFARKVAELDALFRRLGAEFSVNEILGASERATQINRTEYAQPAIFSVQVALAALLDSLGLRPDVVMGHSVGEVAAAHVAGALTLEDAATVSLHRSRLQATLAGRGGMLAVGMPVVDAERRIRHLGDDVCIAAINSPNSVTLAGDAAALGGLASELKRDGIFARPLNVEVPYHSPVMDEIAEAFAQAIADIAPRPNRITYISTVTGGPLAGETLGAAYWNRNVREPVAFARAMRSLVDLKGSHQIVEIGAHPVLSTSIGECLDAAGEKGEPLASLRRNQDDVTTVMSAVGQLYCRGLPGLPEVLFERPARKVHLPTYPWQRSPYWTETNESKRRRTGALADGGKPPHPLLGAWQSSPNPVWRSLIRHDRPAYIGDHRVQGAVVFPGAGFAELALAAAAQTFGHGKGVALENLQIEAPLILDGKPRTGLQISLYGDQQFEIHARADSKDETPWNRHAVGRLGRAEPSEDTVSLASVVDRLAGKRDKVEIYQRFDRLGLQYGPRFRNLDTIWIGQDEALGRISPAPGIESELRDYVLHPAILDAGFQLLAAFPGEGTFLPVGVERLDVHEPGRPVAWTYARITNKGELKIVADITLLGEDGQVVAKVTGFTCQLFETDRRGHAVESGPFIYERLWVPKPLAADAHQSRPAAFMPAPSSIVPDLQEQHRRRIAQDGHPAYDNKAMPALDDLALGYFCDALRERGWEWRVGRSFTAEQVLQETGAALRHAGFVRSMLRHLADAGYLDGDAAGWRLKCNPPAVSEPENWTSFVLAYPGFHAEAMLVQKAGSRLARFLTDEEDALSALFPLGSAVAAHFHSDSPTSRPYNQIVADAVLASVQRVPAGECLRILEVGAGAGGLTSYLLPLLPPARTEYFYTDVSESYLKHARDRFRAFPFVRYEIFDVEQDGEAQGFAAHSFDLIVTSDTLHATVDPRSALGNLRELLAPQGLLALVEMTAHRPWADLVLGLLSGESVVVDNDLRDDHATLPGAQWLSLVQSCGFDECADVTDGLGGDASAQCVVLGRQPPADGQFAMPAEREPADEDSRPIIVLTDRIGVAEPLAHVLQAHNRTVRMVDTSKTNGHDPLASLEGLPGTGPNASMMAPVVVDLRGLSGSTPPDNDTSPAAVGTVACEFVQKVVRLLSDGALKGKPNLWIATNGADAVGGSGEVTLDQAPIRGFVRVLMNERPDLNVRLIDLSRVPVQAEIEALGREIIAESPEDEIALRGDRRFVSRVATGQNLRRSDGRETGYSLEHVSPVPPLDLVFRERAPSPPKPGEVQLRICAAGLNFKDFATYGGLVDLGSAILGLEGAGIVTAVGEGVDDLAVGDRVMGTMDNSLSSPLNTPAKILVRVPDNLSLVEAAGIPTVFLSAYHALSRQARLARGETVMIHTAASGLGLAAIQVARVLGATVLATAGSEEKRAYLRGLGIGYVGDSRTAKFADEVLEYTGGRGVDVVLNTLPAARNADNIEILRPATGRLIDVSSIHYRAKLDLGAMKKGVSVSAFDLHVLIRSNPDHTRELLDELKVLFERGDLRPIPYRVTPLARIAETVESFKKASHIGKIVVSLEDSIVDMQPRRQDIPLRDDGSYLITGGLTGLGLATAKWLAFKGAKTLVLVGRRGGGTPGARDALEAMRASGVDVRAVACDIGDRQQVRGLIAEFGKSLPPLRGIMHAAMVLRDGPISELTTENIHEVLVPKIDGAWNLHRETRDLPLDFFVLYSSAANLIGNWNQANYAAANEYLEAFARFRRINGLPAVAIAWGTIANTGQVASNEGLRTFLGRQGIHDLDDEKIWAALSHGLRGDSPSFVAGIIDWPKAGDFYASIRTSPRFSLQMAGRGAYGAAAASMAGDRSGLAGPSTPGERREILHRVLVDQVAGVLGLDPANLDIDQPLQDLGFDSLMAVELQVAVEKATGQSLQRMGLLDPGLTTAALINEIAAGQSSADGGKDVGAPAEDGQAGPAAPEIRVDDLSDTEVDELLKGLAAGE